MNNPGPKTPSARLALALQSITLDRRRAQGLAQRDKVRVRTASPFWRKPEGRSADLKTSESLWARHHCLRGQE
jgi:hypothetical protein